jgi:formylglycine-generating enzyme required for sulfatase activity
MMILADSGTGKTTFALNYYARSERLKNKNYQVALIPLGHEKVDTYIEDLKKPEIDPSKTVVILDALDEDTLALVDHNERLKSLMKSCEGFKRVIITCRTQFFRAENEIPQTVVGVMRIGGQKAGQGKSYDFFKTYLSPFSNADVRRYLKRRYSWWDYKNRKKAEKTAYKIPLLCARPMLLGHIPELIEARQKIKYAYELYEIMIQAWLKRERDWITESVLRDFSERLSLYIWENRATRKTESVPDKDLSALAKSWHINVEDWKLTGRSLLNRGAESNYKFAHRSIMEYLFVTGFLKLPYDMRPKLNWTDQMKAFLVEMITDNTVTKELQRVELSGVNLLGVNLSGFDLREATLEKARLEIENMLGMRFVYITPGKFMMGSPEHEKGRSIDETLHEVELTKGFYMQTTPVTQAQWKAAMGDNPSYFKGDNCPVERVNWHDAQKFIETLNKKEGKSVYRLPTEAEWEYACRAGTVTPFAFGECLSTDDANYDGNNPLEGCPRGQYRQETTPAGSFRPNAWGLYDMHGNVWEWCADWYGDYPSSSSSIVDPVGPNGGASRVLRGGCWSLDGQDCRSAYRSWGGPDDRLVNGGFRLVLSVGR